MTDFSKLQPFIADSENGKDDVLYLKGFSGRDEIQEFMTALVESGVVTPKERSHPLEIIDTDKQP